ncbi:MAG: Holliday junction branch migration protein RuvA [Paludibacteraceae bacterium]|nr:Holliday junction branch migration protein RuvA [Paludibacteraceae bacterium]
MLEFIRGKIAELNPTYAVIDHQGLGFQVHISLTTYAFLEGKQEAQLYLYESIREDAWTLYGFADKAERSLFLLLISVSGVGAATARMILSSLSVAELCDAVQTGNERVLKSVKGLGTKSAQRIIVDLRDKIGQVGVEVPVGTLPTAGSAVREEALAALTMLGFAPAASTKVLDKLLQEQPGLKVEELIKQALKLV